MTKRIFLVHGWGGAPHHGWFPWLKWELEAKGLDVIVPQLPDANVPRIANWVPALAAAVGTADEQTYFVGHSLGCQTIARYLETLPDDIKVGGAVFVAGFFKRLTGLEDDEEVRDVASEWLDTPLDLARVKTHLPKSVAIFSDDDYYVPLDNQDEFRDELDSEIIVEHSMGHFSGDRDGTTELPVVLTALEKIWTTATNN